MKDFPSIWPYSHVSWSSPFLTSSSSWLLWTVFRWKMAGTEATQSLTEMCKSSTKMRSIIIVIVIIMFKNIITIIIVKTSTRMGSIKIIIIVFYIITTIAMVKISIKEMSVFLAWKNCIVQSFPPDIYRPRELLCEPCYSHHHHKQGPFLNSWKYTRTRSWKSFHFTQSFSCTMVAKYFLVKLLRQVSHMMRRLRLNMYRAEDEMYIIRC